MTDSFVIRYRVTPDLSIKVNIFPSLLKMQFDKRVKRTTKSLFWHSDSNCFEQFKIRSTKQVVFNVKDINVLMGVSQFLFCHQTFKTTQSL